MKKYLLFSVFAFCLIALGADQKVNVSQLAQSGATTNQIPVWNGTVWTPGATAISTPVSIANGGTNATTAKLARVNINQGETALTDGSTINTDCSTGNVFTVTIAGNRTMAAPTNMVAGATYIFEVTQDGTGSRTLTWNSAFKWPGGTAPTLTTTAGATDVITAVSNGSVMRCTFALDLR